MTAPTGRHVAHVVATADLTPRLRRVVLRAPSLTALPLLPAQDVGLVFAGPLGRELRRRYTIRDVDPSAQTLALDGILHGHGPGAAWFADVRPGTEVTLVGPRGKVALKDADWHLFVGDEAGLPAFVELAAALPANASARAFVEVTDGDDEVAVPGVDTTWVHRGEAAAGGSDLLQAALTAASLPAGRGAAYLLGESRAMTALRPVVQEHGVNPADVFLKGYWNRGRGG